MRNTVHSSSFMVHSNHKKSIIDLDIRYLFFTMPAFLLVNRQVGKAGTMNEENPGYPPIPGDSRKGWEYGTVANIRTSHSAILNTVLKFTEFTESGTKAQSLKVLNLLTMDGANA